MDLRRLGVALVAGAAAFLLVGVAVTAVLEPTIEFSLFIGLPAGFIAAVIATGFVALTVNDPDPRRNAAGVATGAAGVCIVLVTLAGLLVRYRFSQTLYIAAGTGAVVLVVAYVLATRTRENPL